MSAAIFLFIRTIAIESDILKSGGCLMPVGKAAGRQVCCIKAWHRHISRVASPAATPTSRTHRFPSTIHPSITHPIGIRVKCVSPRVLFILFEVQIAVLRPRRRFARFRWRSQAKTSAVCTSAQHLRLSSSLPRTSTTRASPASQRTLLSTVSVSGKPELAPLFR